MRRLREVARGAAVLVRHGTASELRAFGRAPGECGIPGKVCSAALALFAAAVVGMLLSKFAAMYSAAEVSGEFDPTARREELCALLFFAVFLAGAADAACATAERFFRSERVRLIVALPLSPVSVYIGESMWLWVRKGVSSACALAVAAAAVGVGTSADESFYFSALPVLFLLPSAAYFTGSLFALPVRAVARFLSSRPLVALLFAVAVSFAACALYAVVLSAAADASVWEGYPSSSAAGAAEELAEASRFLFPGSLFAAVTEGDGEAAAAAVCGTAALFVLSCAVGGLVTVPAAQGRLFGQGESGKRGRAPSPLPAFAALVRREALSALRAPQGAFGWVTVAALMPFAVYCCTDVFLKPVRSMLAADVALPVAMFFGMTFLALANSSCARACLPDAEFMTIKTLPLGCCEVVWAKTAVHLLPSVAAAAASAVTLGCTGKLNAADAAVFGAVGACLASAQTFFAFGWGMRRGRVGKHGKKGGECGAALPVAAGVLVALALGVATFLGGIYLRFSEGEEVARVFERALPLAVAAVSLAAASLCLFGRLDRTYARAGEASA